MDAILTPDRKTLIVTSPPNNRVFPPGPGERDCNIALQDMALTKFVLGWVFVTIDDVTSEAAHVMVGNGLSPPVKDQGIPFL